MLKLSENLDLPLDFVTERIAFLARTGAGKSGGMRVLFEQMFDAGQFCVFIDPKGDAWGIRAAGEKEGKPVLVIGGDHADIPLEPTAGRYLAEFLVRERVSTVLDLSDLSTQQMWTFVSDLGSRMYKLNRDICHIFIDEADMIAGQQFFDPHCLHAIQLIQNKGRGRGFGMTIATQRPQILNKTILNASGTLIAMQTLGDDALKVVKSWLGQTGSKEVVNAILAELPTMQNREAFVYSPQTLGVEPVRIRFASFQTFDSMRTPRPGEVRQQPRSLADIDLTAIEREMAETIERAQAEDPKALKKRIAELEREIYEARKSVNSSSTVVEVEIEKQVAVVPIGLLDELDNVGLRTLAAEQAVREMSDELKALHGHILEMGNKYKKYPVSSPSPITTPWPEPVAERSSASDDRRKNATPVAPRPASLDSDLSAPEQKVLDSLAFALSLGIEQPERINVAFFAGYTVNGHFNNVVGKLNSKGLIRYPAGGLLELTEEGRSAADAGSIHIRTLEDLHNLWRSKLAEPQRRVLNVLLSHEGRPISREDLAAQSGYTVNGHFNNTVGKLNTLGAAHYPIKGYVAAAPVMFPEGLF